MRSKVSKISTLINQISARFSDPVKAKTFMEHIRTEKLRYIRDQVMLIQKAIKDRSSVAVDKALEFCLKNKLYRATDFQDTVLHYQKEKQVLNDTFSVSVETSSLAADTLEKIKTTPKIRDMSEYINALGGNDNANYN